MKHWVSVCYLETRLTTMAIPPPNTPCIVFIASFDVCGTHNVGILAIPAISDAPNTQYNPLVSGTSP